MNRHDMLRGAVKVLALLAMIGTGTGEEPGGGSEADRVTLFLCGDVMTGRGLDQVLPHPSDPRLHEDYVKDARRYLELAEKASGRIRRPVGFSDPWGDALAVLERIGPDARIINLETAVTTSDDHWEGKGIHYRMHPRNVPCLAAAKIDCCVLANNHVLDWGYPGLAETVQTLEKAGLASAGAGRDESAARAPAVIPLADGRRVLVFAFGDGSSGIPRAWAAKGKRPGVHLVPDLTKRTAQRLAAGMRAARREGDVVVASIHWGSNWGYEIPGRHRSFAHALIEAGGADVIHGHSSHHPRAIEVHRGKPILYGCGDFLNDYEGIAGYESYRGDLALMYFLTMDAVRGELAGLEMVPTQTRRFRVRHASEDDARWLRETMDRECARFGGQVQADGKGSLVFRWGGPE